MASCSKNPLPALDEPALVVDVVELPHAVEEVVHAGEVGADAHLVLLLRVLAAHLVEACKHGEDGTRLLLSH